MEPYGGGIDLESSYSIAILPKLPGYDSLVSSGQKFKIGVAKYKLKELYIITFSKVLMSLRVYISTSHI